MRFWSRKTLRRKCSTLSANTGFSSAHVREMGRRFDAGFARLKDKYPDLVAGWRRRGLMMGFELTNDTLGPMMTYALGHHGILAIFADFRPSTLQVMPPLIIQPDEVQEVLAGFDHALGMVREMVARGVPAPAIR